MLGNRVLDIGLAAVFVGLLFLFVARIDGGKPSSLPETADIGAQVAETTSGVSGGQQGDKRGDSEVTRRVTMVSPSVSPTVTSTISASPSSQKSPPPGLSSVSSPSHAPSPAPPAPSKTPTPLAVVSPSPMPVLSPTPTQPTGTAYVVINEIAWAGTVANPSDEWLELFNAGDTAQELNGWYLCEGDSKILSFGSSNRIEPGAFFLIERGTDDLSTNVEANFATSFSGSPAGLSNAGEHLILRDGACGQGAIIDEVGPGAWYAGSASPDYVTMERIDPTKSGSLSSNWASNDGVTIKGLDADKNPIKGTPKARNSVAR